MDLTVSMELAESYRLAARFREASAGFERALARLTALGRDDTERAGTLLNNWGMVLHDIGRPLDAERAFRRAIGISSDGTEDGVSPMLLNNLARTLRDLRRLTEARGYAERGYAKARRIGVGPGAISSDIGSASLALGRALLGQGKSTEAHAALSSAVEHLTPTLGADHPYARLAAKLVASNGGTR